MAGRVDHPGLSEQRPPCPPPGGGTSGSLPSRGPSPDEQRGKASPVKSGLSEELIQSLPRVSCLLTQMPAPLPASPATLRPPHSAVRKHKTANGPCSWADGGPLPRFLASWSSSFRQVTYRATPTEVPLSVKSGSRKIPPRGTGRCPAGVKEETSGTGFPGDLPCCDLLEKRLPSEPLPRSGQGSWRSPEVENRNPNLHVCAAQTGSHEVTPVPAAWRM